MKFFSFVLGGSVIVALGRLNNLDGSIVSSESSLGSECKNFLLILGFPGINIADKNEESQLQIVRDDSPFVLTVDNRTDFFVALFIEGQKTAPQG